MSLRHISVSPQSRQILILTIEQDQTIPAHQRQRLFEAIHDMTPSDHIELLTFSETLTRLNLSETTFRRALKATESDPHHPLRPIYLPGSSNPRWSLGQILKFLGGVAHKPDIRRVRHV